MIQSKWKFDFRGDTSYFIFRSPFTYVRAMFIAPFTIVASPKDCPLPMSINLGSKSEWPENDGCSKNYTVLNLGLVCMDWNVKRDKWMVRASSH